MTDDIFTTGQAISDDVLLADDDAADLGDDLADPLLDDTALIEEEEDPDAVEEDSYDDTDDF
jgi:hypothetical protein